MTPVKALAFMPALSITALLVGLWLSVGSASVNGDAPSKPLGTITRMTPDPLHYGDIVRFSWVLAHKPLYPTLGIFCSQGGWVFIGEMSVSRDLTGSGGFAVDNEHSSAIPGQIDLTQPCQGQAFLWDEGRSANQGPTPITSQTFFEVQP